MADEELKLKLKEQVISYLNLLEVKPEDINTADPLFGPETKLDLDSIDSIELSVLLEREYGIKITDPKEGRKVMATLDSMIAYIKEHGKA